MGRWPNFEDVITNLTLRMGLRAKMTGTMSHSSRYLSFISFGLGTYKAVKARFRTCLSGKSPQNLVRCSVFAPKGNLIWRMKLRAKRTGTISHLSRYLTPQTALERSRHIEDSQGPILVLPFRSKFVNRCKLFPQGEPDFEDGLAGEEDRHDVPLISVFELHQLP